MRPQQQNRRMRGRNNNNNNNNNNNRGKGNPNPLARSYESNGPDVKIRGNAQQIAEKYTTLARDAMSSGDRVMAENYLQHAEHYNRIIAAYQAQLPAQNPNQNRDDFDDEDGEERDDADMSGGGEQPNVTAYGQQGGQDAGSSEIALNGENGGNAQPREQNGREFRNRDRRDGRDRDGRDRNRDYQNGQRNDRNGEGRRDGQRRDPEQAEASAEETTTDSLPDFLTGGAQPAEAAPSREDSAPRRSRRPRRGERPRDDDAGDGEASEAPARAEAVAVSDE